MTCRRDAAAVLILAFAFGPVQTLRIPTDPAGFTHTEVVSKYGIMFSTDVFPLKPSSDTKSISTDDFTSLTLESWTRDDTISKHVAVWNSSSLGVGEKATDAALAYALLENSKKHGTTTIHHSMYIDAINTKTDSTQTVYVISSALPAFIQKVMPNVHRPFVLVTGDSILKTPSALGSKEYIRNFIDNPLIVHWFAQNGHLEHSKFTRIPNGLDYHTLALNSDKKPEWGPRMSAQQQDDMLRQVRDTAPEFSQRKSKVLVGFSMSVGTRSGVAESFMKSHIHQSISKGDREHYWKEIASLKYVASPSGAGWDCHRTWEALALGSIPLIESTGIDKLFLDNELPVHIIHDWKEVEGLEESQLAEKFGERTQAQSMLPAMTLKFWVDMIKSKASEFRTKSKS